MGLRLYSLVGYSIIALAISTLFGRPLVKLFLDASETVIIDNVRLFLTLATAFYFPLVISAYFLVRKKLRRMRGE